MTLRELQLFALDILKDVADFCDKNNIKYSLYGGTLLGAIRHQGFIPWDDDIDIIMPREDYNRFCRTYKSDKYKVVNRDLDKSYQFAFSRVCDFNKTFCEVMNPYSYKLIGVFIDVFPADGCPPNENDIATFYKKNQELYKKTMLVREKMRHPSKEWDRYRRSRNNHNAVRTLLHMLVFFVKKYYLLYFVGGRRYVKQLMELNTTYAFGGTPYWGSFSCLYEHMVYNPIESFNGSCIKCKFEDEEFCVMKGYDGYLKRVYGDYMELPPKEQQTPPMANFYKFFWKIN
jgi:lipopolysaccharide cholinephosphotransferase